METLHDDWNAFLKLLVARRVRFVIVGGHAVAAHGRPRMTADLDVWIDPSPPNARRAAAAIAEFGFGTVDADRLTRPKQVVFMGREPYRIDVLTSVDGVSFARAWAGRLAGTLGNVRVAFIGRTELLRNKRAAGRPKDLLDLELLRKSPSRQPSRRKRRKKR
jgi:hypothetical protein